jgi:hypothetical protein
MKKHATVMMLASLALGACAVDQQEPMQSSSDELGFVGSGDWTVFKLVTGPNPAEKIEGHVSGYVSPEIGRTMLIADVAGLPANRTFGAHLHAAACDDKQGGGHYQHVGTTVGDQNEVWMDFTTDAAGAAVVVARKPYAIATERAKSVVVHAQATDPATGKAGDKLACIDVTFTDAAAQGAPQAAGKSCSTSYQCTNGACACGGPKEGTTCASPADCEKTCASCE